MVNELSSKAAYIKQFLHMRGSMMLKASFVVIMGQMVTWKLRLETNM